MGKLPEDHKEAAQRWLDGKNRAIAYLCTTSAEALTVVLNTLKAAGVLAWGATVNDISPDTRTFYVTGRLDPAAVFATAAKIQVSSRNLHVAHQNSVTFPRFFIVEKLEEDLKAAFDLQRAEHSSRKTLFDQFLRQKKKKSKKKKKKKEVLPLSFTLIFVCDLSPQTLQRQHQHLPSKSWMTASRSCVLSWKLGELQRRLRGIHFPQSIQR